MLESLENILIAISRYFLIILGTISLLISILVFLYSLSLITDKPNTKSLNIKTSSYTNYSDDLFPKSLSNIKQNSLKVNTSINEKTSSSSPLKPVDSIYIKLRDSISFHFNDSQEMINLFKQNITPRSLESYIKEEYLGNLSDKQSTDSLFLLLKLFNDMKNINDFKKIGNFDSRLELVSELIKLFFDDVYLSIENNQIIKNKAIQDSISNNTKGYSYLVYVLYALAIYAAAVLYLMIFKVEIDLRRIPPAIKNEDS